MAAKAQITRTQETKAATALSATQKPVNHPVLEESDAPLFLMQKALGNQVVQGLVKSGFIQAKITIGQGYNRFHQAPGQKTTTNKNYLRLQNARDNQTVQRLFQSDSIQVRQHLCEASIQRECPPPERLGRIPGPEPCSNADPNERSPDPFDIPLRFCFDSDNLINADRGNIAPLRTRLGILTLAAGRSVHIHAYSSLPGSMTYNRRLACHRAAAIKNILALRTLAPIHLYAHGATSIFGPPVENQRAIVTVDPLPRTTPPPAPVPPPARTLPSGPFLDLQIACVTDRGGCTTPASIYYYNAICRNETGYQGQDLVEEDLICGTPGMGIAQSLERAYPNWRGILPNCPCTRNEAASSSDFSRDLNPFLSSFHPGADVCYRSNPVSSAAGTEHRQHCCYTRGGMLITEGGGAGTPDVWSGFLRHQRMDVQPFNEFNRDYRIYNRYWVPDRGSNCPASDPCINQCEQRFEACTAGQPSCLAERQRCLNQCRR